MNNLTTPPKAFEAYHPSHVEAGKKLMSEGKVGALIIAGGQGTRLGFDGPKGTFPISPINGKTLLQITAERTLAASKMAGRSLQLAVMTSPQNDQQIKEHFQELHLEDLEISFFTQEVLPFMTDEGVPVKDSEGKLIEGPNGNGRCLHSFVQSGLWEKWHSLGIEYINIIPVDNVLALPFDPELLGWHHELGGDVVAKCIERRDPKELVGVFINENDKLSVIEYSELPDGLESPYAHIGLYSLTMAFAERISTKELPLHKALKKVKPLNIQAWKSEYFIFDILEFSDKTSLLLYPRDEVFAPLKNKEGIDSPETAQAALQNYEKALFKKITGKELEESTIEIDPQYYYWYNTP